MKEIIFIKQPNESAQGLWYVFKCIGAMVALGGLLYFGSMILYTMGG